MNQIIEAFSNPQHVASYTDGPPRVVPGYIGMQRMSALLLAERVPDEGRVLVLGAGGGLELKVFAEAHPNWMLLGIDPSAEMLKLAEHVLGPLASRVTLQQGTIDAAGTGAFDGAACLLTMHFLPREERRRTAAEVRRRLKPGSPFVVAHFSIPDGESERVLWLSRYASFAIASGIEREKVEAAQAAIDEMLPILTPEQDETILREAGFSNISLFYAGFTFRGWVAYA
ncbi:MAG: class I SAM-dependent methyltransferase [Xanthobacteraceae bacterium]